MYILDDSTAKYETTNKQNILLFFNPFLLLSFHYFSNYLKNESIRGKQRDIIPEKLTINYFANKKQSNY